jgi:hypothetical protein
MACAGEAYTHRVLRPLLVLAALAPSPAGAAMMPHYDLASLALESAVIVRAERTGGPDEAARYRVVRVLAGTGLRARETLTIDQSVYRFDANGSFTGQPITAPLEATAILFLKRGHDASVPWRLVGSGLRVFAGGRAYRFQQFDNPGPYVALPQRRDPDDLFGDDTSPQLTLAQLEAAIATAVARADRARTAIAARDVPAILALLPPAPVETPGFTFYQDRIAVRAFEALIAAREIDGALDVLARTRGLRPWFAEGVHDAELLQRMEDASAPLARRLGAVAIMEMMPSDDTLRRLFVLARDTAGPRELRVAVIDRLAHYEGLSASDPAWPARRRGLERELTALVRNGVRREGDDEVRVALVAAAARWELRNTVPGSQPFALSAYRQGTRVHFRGAARQGSVAESYEVVLVRPDGSACDAPVLTSSMSQQSWSGTLDGARCSDAVRARQEIGPAGRVLVVPIR